MIESINLEEKILFTEFKNQILSDYKLLCESRETSIAGRKDVFTGRGKFGVFGDGKELAQIALSKYFKPGDWRAGYYRDQTMMMALELVNPEQFFSQLYANTDKKLEPCSGGRQMNAHFGSRFLDENGDFLSQTDCYNSSSDVSTTAGQIPRMVGLAQASKVYRQTPTLDENSFFSNQGNEVVFGTIGDASTSQGLFWEGINAAGVMQLPIVLSIWDDGYGISVPSEYHHAKDSIYECLLGFQKNGKENGIEIIQVNGWDYPELIKAYKKADKLARKSHVPVIVHVKELTQQLGHTTSGSHERYKSKDRLLWEKEFDCLVKFEEWILSFGINDHSEKIASIEELDAIKQEAKGKIRQAKKDAWTKYQNEILEFRNQTIHQLELLKEKYSSHIIIKDTIESLEESRNFYKNEIFHVLRKIIRIIATENTTERTNFLTWYHKSKEKHQYSYSSHLSSESKQNHTYIPYKEIKLNENLDKTDGRIIIRDNFDKLLSQHKNLLIFGEDVGNIGDVNQGLEGLQEKYGIERVFDTGIRESTIIGQGIGMAMRGLRPIAEIQYLDYVLFALETISDDLASLHYRTAGGQKAPLIIRTRGHRLEGIWHSGSPMAGLLNFMRGILFLVPRNMTKAAGFYNALMHCDEPAIVVEVLNGYRLKETTPINYGEFTTPIGEVEITKEGNDITLVTYGATWKNATEAAMQLKEFDIDVEVIDIQSLLPFDISKNILKSLQKTNRLVVVDEDVPGGASAYILQNILEEQDAYHYLDSKPKTITAKAHRPAYSSDGDYFSKPSADDIFEEIHQMMHEDNPTKYPSLF